VADKHWQWINLVIRQEKKTGDVCKSLRRGFGILQEVAKWIL